MLSLLPERPGSAGSGFIPFLFLRGPVQTPADIPLTPCPFHWETLEAEGLCM